MKARLVYLLKYYLFWIVFFVVQKPFFMLWQRNLLGEVRPIDWVLVPWHGLPLDLSVAAYITMVAGVLLCVSCWVSWHVMRHIIKGLTALVLFVALWTLLGDNGCFPSWGYHLNKDIFSYLSSPAEALACAQWWVWLLGCVAFLVLFIGWGWLYLKWMRCPTIYPIEGRRAQGIGTLVLLIVTGALFLPMRGSVTVSTMNTGRVYYSTNRMLNIAAINPVFNIIETLSEDRFVPNRYNYMPHEEAQHIVQQLVNSNDPIQLTDTLLNTQRPHIVVCILESFSKNAMEAGAMPRLSELTQEGVFFSNAYAASYRTDRGVMAVLGAFPSCATASLMLLPSKSGQLPQIGQVLKEEGYQLKFYYGGDEDFTNMRSYLITGGFDNRVADRDFPLADRMSKWGVPDHILFSKATKEIASRKREDPPTLDVILSLSSHEPFEVPYHHINHPYLNAIAYTDSCLGAFVDSLRMSERWSNTVVVLVADHGYLYPDGIANHDPLHFKIPLVMVGGAVRAPREINKLCQQIDWVPTLLHQMGLDASQFGFAKDIMDERANSYAYYNFGDGFALITDTSKVVVDASANQIIMGDSTNLEQQAKAITQTIMETINRL